MYFNQKSEIYKNVKNNFLSCQLYQYQLYIFFMLFFFNIKFELETEDYSKTQRSLYILWN